MLTADPADPTAPSDTSSRVAVVLVRARNPNNIGAVARAMHDFGFHDLRIVNDHPVPFEDARSAVDASAILQAAAVYPNLADAVAGCTLVLGTTAVGERRLQHPVYELAAAAPRIHAHLIRPEHRVALLLGSEKTGLSNEELSHCHWLLTIPMYAVEAKRHPSMNLGQAAAVCLYELSRSEPAALLADPAAPPADELERLTLRLSDLLELSGYRKHHPAHSDLIEVRRLVRRMVRSPEDGTIWLGILRQALWKLRRQSS